MFSFSDENPKKFNIKTGEKPRINQIDESLHGKHKKNSDLQEQLKQLNMEN